nr:GYF domain containing protein [Hymenolepis microstoma]
MLEIREAFIAVGDPSKYPIINSVISRDPEKRPHFRKHKPTGDGITIPNRTPRRNEHYAGSYEPNGDGSVPHSAGWRRTRRTSGASVPQSPLDGHSAHRNNSGSSNSEENGNNSVTEGSGQFRREFDWTLGCGKWRHRSTSGSERLGHKGGFFVSAGRGRGRGGGNGVGGNDGNGGGFTGPPRGRGFMRRPFQHGAAGPSRGGARGGLRHSPFNNLGSDHGPKEEDFEPQDERHLQQYQHFPPHSQHQFHRHDAGGPCDGGQLHQEKQEEVPSSLDNHAQTQVSVSNRPSEQVHEHTPQFTSPLHHAPDISTNNPTETAATNAPGGAGYTFMSSNSPPLPPHLLKLQSSPGQTGLCETQAPLPTMWYYRDPHSNIHGPFNDATMRAWYEAGYFKSGIEMRRECDKVFSKLSEYESRLGGHPFINSRSLAPIENPLPNSTTLQPTQQSMINPLGSILSSPLSGVIASGLPISMDLLRPPILTQQHQAMRSSQQASSSSIQDPTSASKTLFDLASMSQMTLMDMLRLRQIAQLAANSASQPSGSAIDEKTIADALAALNIGLPVNATPQTPLQSVSFPPNVIDLQQLEAAIHRRQQEEEEAQKRADAGDRAGQHQEQELEAAKLTEVEKDPIEKEVTAPQLQKKRKDKAKKVVSAQEEQQKLEDESKQSTAPFVEQQEQQPTATTTTSASKKKKRKSKNASAGAAAETKPDEVEKGTAVNTDFIEPEDGWVAVPPSGSTFTPQPLPQNATLWHQQENTGRDQPSRKSKRKKGKLSAAELQQQAWEQEEERRRKANAERIAREEAEQAALAAALAEEEAAGNVATSSNAKMTAAARRQLEEAQRARQQQLAREAAKKEAETILASFKLPPTAKWGGANKNVAGVATSSMADILASQMQEEEFESMKPNAGHATFASKVASGTHAHQPTPSKTAGKPKFFVAVDGQSSTQAATKQQQPIKQPAKSSQKAPPAIPSKISKASQSAAVAPKALNVTSIWNMAVDINSTAKSANTKKDRKKKKTNANSNLLTGSIISLTPKARQELEKWCENKLSAFQPGNVDIPTLISVLCDMEEDQDVLECIESSFGKSQRVSNFSKAFVEKRATLMGATA